jgi:hypothetical protein
MSVINFLGGAVAGFWLLVPYPHPRIAVYLAARVPHRFRSVSLYVFSVFFISSIFSSSLWLVLSFVGYFFPGFSQWLL